MPSYAIDTINAHTRVAATTLPGIRSDYTAWWSVVELVLCVTFERGRKDRWHQQELASQARSTPLYGQRNYSNRSLLSDSWLASTKFVSAFANFATSMQLGAAFRALLFPSLPSRFLYFRLGDFCCSQFEQPRFIRLLHCALWMDSAL